MTWECHVDDYIEGRYDMILGSDLLKYIILESETSRNIFVVGDKPYE